MHNTIQVPDQPRLPVLRPGMHFHGYDAAVLKGLEILDVRDGSPSFVELQNVFAIPKYSVLFDEHGRRIEITARSYRPPEMYTTSQFEALIAKAHERAPLHTELPGDPEIISEPMFFSGVFNAHFGHFLTDALSRFWSGKQRETFNRFFYQGLNQDIAEKHEFARIVLKGGGVDLSRRFHAGRPVLFRNLTVPLPSFQSDRRIFSIHPEFHAVAARAIIGKGDDDSEAIYLSRSALSQDHRGGNNETALEATLARHGIRVVHPERLTMAEQIKLFNGRRRIMSCCGSALHNVLFNMRRGAGSVLVNLTLPFIDMRYPLIDAIMLHESHYLNACNLLPGESKSRGRFVIDIGRVMDFLSETKVI